MRNRRGSIILPDGFTTEMVYLTTFFSGMQQDTGILIMGENLGAVEKASTLRLYLLKRFDLFWHVQEELQAFAFVDEKSAYSFLEDLPSMSALDLLIKVSNKVID